MAVAPEAQHELVAFTEDPTDVTGNSEIFSRTEAWDGFGRGWTQEECRTAGRIVAGVFAEHCDTQGEETLIMATRLAIQKPPLLGSKLAEFVIGAQEVAQTQ